jgi:hypothetical protein
MFLFLFLFFFLALLRQNNVTLLLGIHPPTPLKTNKKHALVNKSPNVHVLTHEYLARVLIKVQIIYIRNI